MYGKNKIITAPSDAQAKEKLAMYVHEYLVHIGAQKTANSFLQEIRWDKSISVGEPPGFLHSWWSVFWDLYSAAPERRDTHEHTNEAKSFHDYGFVNSGYPNGLSQEHYMAGRPMPNAPPFFHRVSQPGQHPALQGPVSCMPPSLGVGPTEPIGVMRQRPSLPPMMPGGPIPGPQMHPSMRFHQPTYGPPGGGMLSGPPGHPHLPPRTRWLGPGASHSQGPPQHQPPCSGIGPIHQPQPPGMGVAPSPGHPGTPGGGPSVASPNNGINPNPESQQPPPHYTNQQQTPPPSSSALSNEQQQIFTSRNDFDGGAPIMMNGGNGRNSGSMMPPPPPEYGLPPNSVGPGISYPGAEVKMSPMHSVNMLGGGPPPPNGSGQQAMMLSSDYGGGGSFGGGGGPQSQIPPEMMSTGNGGPPQTTSNSGPPMMIQQQHQQSHNAAATGPAPPAPQYMSSAGGLCGSGPVQFPQEYAFNSIS